MAKTSYTVVFERDEDGWWVATVKGVAGVHTQGRTVAQARERIREALTAAGENSKAELVDQFALSADLLQQLDAARSARRRSESVQQEAQTAMRSAALALAHRGVSTRDAGYFLELSHQRIHQLLRSGTGRRRSWLKNPERGKRSK
jgi:predicted RNase H-like HicB family nuclease